MNGMKHFLIFVVFITCCRAATVQAGNGDDLNRLRSFMKNLATFESNYTQEKVYLHLDNNGYFPGEKIWYKAYVTRASTLLPTDMSKVLYVELVTPMGEVKERQTLPIYNGRTYGCFSLDNVFQTGFYEVRAYTRAMLNWDASYLYSRVIPIYNIPEDTTQFTKLSMFDYPADEKLLNKRPTPGPLLDNGSRKCGKLIMTFYPEGGHLTKGLGGRVAYKLTDEAGLPVAPMLTLVRSDGEELQTSAPLHEGMGVFRLPSDWVGGYVKAVDGNGDVQQFRLPKVQETGCAFEVETDKDNNIDISVSTRGIEGLLGISVTCRGRLFGFDTLRATPATVTRTFRRKALHDGIHQVTLFTQDGEILAERLVWVEPRRKPMVFEVKQNREVYSPFSPIVLDFTLKNADGKPMRSEFSLSVQDVDGMVGADAAGLKTDMLLSSDLKGYVHNPDWYFEAYDSLHRRAHELLLMVQGWRRYEWKQMVGLDTIRINYPVEEALTVDGKIASFSKDHEGKAGLDVKMVLIDGTGLSMGESITDSLGKFAMRFGREVYGDNYGYFTVLRKTKKGKGKRVRAAVMLNRSFYPDPLAYEPVEMQTESAKDLRHDMSVSRPDTFEWKDDKGPGKKVHKLRPVKVKGKSRFPSYERDAMTAARQEGALYYNMEDEIEKLRDSGAIYAYIWDWLEKRNPYFSHYYRTSPGMNYWEPYNQGIGISYEHYRSPFEYNPYGFDNSLFSQFHSYGFSDAQPSYLSFSYRKKKAVVLLNGKLQSSLSEDIDLLGCEVKSLVICPVTDALRELYPALNKGRFSTTYHESLNNMSKEMAIKMTPPEHYAYALIVTTYASPPFLLDDKKGIRTTLLHGYSRVADFYSPDYRTVDVPDGKDVRRTLYWNPAVETDKHGKARVSLFSNSRALQRIHINAQGMAVNGQMFSLE